MSNPPTDRRASPLDPEVISPAERLEEAAFLLARGILRRRPSPLAAVGSPLRAIHRRLEPQHFRILRSRLPQAGRKQPRCLPIPHLIEVSLVCAHAPLLRQPPLHSIS